MNKEVVEMIHRIGSELNISIDSLFEAVEAAMVTASRKVMGASANIVSAKINRETGDLSVFGTKSVVDEVEDDISEISLEEARQFKADADYDDDIDVEVTPEEDDFDRIAAQSAKQMITQRIREAEREMVYEKYHGQESKLATGKVLRFARGNVIMAIESAEAILPFNEQAPGERFRFGDRVKAVIKEVWDGKRDESRPAPRRSSRDPQITVTRRDPNLVLYLFDEAVSEIRDGVVSIRLVAREPGKRSKIAVLSSDSNVDAVGACVGMKGSRVQMVVQELQGERIDIVEYSSDLRRFVSNSLKPAEVENVEILVDENGVRRASVVVREDQHALAIGKNGLNANLASRLTGIEIDIVAEADISNRMQDSLMALMGVEGITETIATGLLMENIFTLEGVQEAGLPALMRIEGMEEDTASTILASVDRVLSGEEDEEEEIVEEIIEVEEGEELELAEGEEYEYIEVIEEVYEDEEEEEEVSEEVEMAAGEEAVVEEPQS
jgi:transcription termination/antitermination protein NusA